MRGGERKGEPFLVIVWSGFSQLETKGVIGLGVRIQLFHLTIEKLRPGFEFRMTHFFGFSTQRNHITFFLFLSLIE